MAWTKIPKEHHDVFYRVVPKDPRIRTIQMFGGVCATVHGNMFAGLWADSMLVRLPPREREAALAIGSTAFDPMGRGRPSPDMIVLPPEVMGDPEEMERWFHRGLEHTASFPPKVKKEKRAAKATGKAPAKKRATKAPVKRTTKAPAKRTTKASTAPAKKKRTTHASAKKPIAAAKQRARKRTKR